MLGINTVLLEIKPPEAVISNIGLNVFRNKSDAHTEHYAVEIVFVRVARRRN